MAILRLETNATMKNPMRQWSASPGQLATIVILIIALYFVAGVVNRGLNVWSLKQQQHALEQKQKELIDKREQLRAEIEYMQSPSYVEQAARTMLLWGPPGETLIVSTDVALPTPTTVPTRTP